MRAALFAAALVAAPALADDPREFDTWIESEDEVGLTRAAALREALEEGEPEAELRARAAEVRRAPPPAEKRPLDDGASPGDPSPGDASRNDDGAEEDAAPPRDGDEPDATEGGALPADEALPADDEAEEATDGDDDDALAPDGG